MEVSAEGRIADGGMRYLGVNAVEGRSPFLDLVRDGLSPALYQGVTAMPVVPARVPPRLILPLHQHIGQPAEALVKPGDRVLKGELSGRDG